MIPTTVSPAGTDRLQHWVDFRLGQIVLTDPDLLDLEVGATAGAGGLIRRRRVVCRSVCTGPHSSPGPLMRQVGAMQIRPLGVPGERSTRERSPPLRPPGHMTSGEEAR